MRPLRLAVSTLVAIGAMVIAAGDSPAARKETLKEWLDGPVHYLVDSAEIKEFKSLKTDKDRAAFIERFWRRRDPTPNTLVNEYRQLFWNRVKEANEKFLDTPGPGWQTDRGKIYILYGPPNEEKEDPNATTNGSATDGKGLIRWVYVNPGNRKDMAPVVYVPFVRDVTGEYHVSYDPKLSSPFFTWFQVEDNRTVGLGNLLSSTQPGSGDPLSVMLDLGKMQEVPPQEELILDSVETVETFAYEPLPLAIDRFQPGGTGLLVVLTVAVPGPPGAEPPSILARFYHKGMKSGAQILGEGSFRVDGEGDQRVAQGRLLLDATSWDVTVLSVEAGTGASRIYRGRVNPLPPGPAVHLSDIVLARAMEPLAFAAQASYDAPYIIGGFNVTPRPTSAIVRGTPVRVYFEIYGGTSPYHLAYQLEGQEKDGHWVALGKPQENDATQRGQGFELATAATWPTGTYRLRIKVVDAVAGATESAVSFTLVPAPAP